MMLHSIKQIVLVVFTLVMMLMLPVLIQSHSKNKDLKKSPEILEQSASTSNVLGVTTINFANMNNQESSSKWFQLSSYQKYINYSLGILFVISVFYFIRFKYKKDKYGIK